MFLESNSFYFCLSSVKYRGKYWINCKNFNGYSGNIFADENQKILTTDLSFEDFALWSFLFLFFFGAFKSYSSVSIFLLYFSRNKKCVWVSVNIVRLVSEINPNLLLSAFTEFLLWSESTKGIIVFEFFYEWS